MADGNFTLNSKMIIWQYWETREHKPLFVDGLHSIAKKNSGVEVIQVTPETLASYIPNIPEELFEISELAHKADMIRAMLLYHHGGMWLDSDAIVLSSLVWIFDLLDRYEFVGFNDVGFTKSVPLNVRINCFVTRPKSSVIGEWMVAQHSKFPKVDYDWTEVGTELLDPIILKHEANVCLLPFNRVCPIRWNEVEKFNSTFQNSRKILKDTVVVMLSNKELQRRLPEMAHMSLDEMAQGHTLIANILKRALDSCYVPPHYLEVLSSGFFRLLFGQKY